MSRIVLVSGASRGIGAAMSKSFLELGDHVVGLSRSQFDTSFHSRMDSIICDMTEPDSIIRAVDLVKTRYGRIDVLLNNAGVAHSNPLDQISDNDPWNSIIETNLSGPYHLMKSSIPLMPDESGRMICLGSISSFRGSSTISAYAASKHAIIGLTRSFAKYLAPKRITVNAICPGFVDTDMLRHHLVATGKTIESLLDNVPLRRLIAPEEVANAAIYLASAAARNITGQCLILDGGLLA